MVNWGTISFSVASPVAITGIRLDKNIYRGNESLKAEIDLAGTKKEQIVLKAELLDKHGRLLSEKELPIEIGGRKTISLTLPVKEPLATKGIFLSNNK